MKFIETELKGCFIFETQIFKDERGYFFESFNKKSFNDMIGHNVNFIQDNISFSTYGVLRGLHFQKGEAAQAKFVRVLSGRVLDIVVDIRENSPTYGQHFSLELSSKNMKQLFIPRGFAHGFIVLSKTAEFFYKVDNYYAPQSERGIVFNDPQLDIDWKIDESEIIVNTKDLTLPQLKNMYVSI